MKISYVKYAGNHSIHIGFEDGVNGSVNLSDLVESGIFSVLKDVALFSKVYTTGYSVAWSEELEIDAAALYAELTGKNPATFYSSRAHASN